MTFIKRVRIKNFRSIVDAEFEVGNLNIFVGKNDAGKSNVLRALNLFFNNETDYGQPFRFDFDYCKSAVSGKGKAQEVVIELEVVPPPKRFNKSGAVIWTKRWRRDDTKHDEPKYAAGKAKIGSRSNITNWLNKIIYRYVPAIKGEEYFSRLMGELHDVLSVVHSNDFKNQGETFTSGLRGVTRTISDDLENLIGIKNTIQVPANFKDLFIRLDFGMNEADQTYLLKARGDGIKARHIPVILRAMAEKEREIRRSGYVNPDTIWGFEEPENNVEISAAFKMAQQFYDFSFNIQIFLTTHSPAFYSLYDEHEFYVHLFHVKQEGLGRSIIRECGTNALDDEMGVLALVAPFVRSKNDELEKLRNDVEGLKAKAITKPFVILTEDKNYEQTNALQVLFHANGVNKGDIQIIAYHGAGNISAALGLARALKSQHPQTEFIIHRDRDYFSDEKIKEIEVEIRKAGAQPFIPIGVDVESHFLSIEHLAELFDGELSRQEIASVVEVATKKVELASRQRMISTWFQHNKADLGKAGVVVTQLEEQYYSNVERYRYSKKVLKQVRSSLQAKLKRNVDLVVPTKALAGSYFHRFVKI